MTSKIMDTVLTAFENVIREGPLCREPVQGIKVSLMDVKLHEDSIHRGPAQVIPAVRDAVKQAFKSASPIIKEPVQKIRIDAPNTYLGNISKLIGARRGQLVDTEFEGEELIPAGKITISAGVASYPDDGMTSAILIDNADRACYKAKEDGKNRVYVCRGIDFEQLHK